MARKTQMNQITTPELMAQVNPENIRLRDDLEAMIGLPMAG